MRTFTLNKVVYQAKKIGFNTICAWEESGISLDQMQTKPMSMIRAYVAYCANRSIEEIGEEIEKHIIGGGDFKDIMDVLGEEMNESGFFQALGKNAEADDPKKATKAK